MADDAFPTAVHWLVAGVIAVVCLVPLLTYLGHRQRNAVMSYAAVQGWTYHDRDPGLAQRYLGAPFVADLDADAEAVIAGRYLGIPFAAYAYTYQTTVESPGASASATTTHTIPVVVLLMETRLPDVDVTLHMPDAGTTAAPEGDVSPPQSADFDQVFRVESHDPAFAERLLSPEFKQGLLAGPRHNWSWRSGDLLSLGSWNGKPEKIPVFLEHLRTVVRSTPDEVWAAYGTPRPNL